MSLFVANLVVHSITTAAAALTMVLVFWRRNIPPLSTRNVWMLLAMLATMATWLAGEFTDNCT